jgi:hypothetical protein
MWYEVPQIVPPRGHILPSTIPFGGLVLVMGGSVDGGREGLPTDHVAVFDPSEGTWYNISTPLPARRKSPVVGIVGTQMYVGSGDSGDEFVTPTNQVCRNLQTEIASEILLRVYISSLALIGDSSG